MYKLIYILIGLYFSFPSFGEAAYNAENNLNQPIDVVNSIKASDTGYEQEIRYFDSKDFKYNNYSAYYNFLFTNQINPFFTSNIISSQTEDFSFQSQLKASYISKMLC